MPKCIRCYVDVIDAAPRLVLSIIAVLTICALYPASRFLPATQNIVTTAPGSPSEVAKIKLDDLFGRGPPEGDVILIQQAVVPGVRTPDLVQSGLLTELTEAVEAFVQDENLALQVQGYETFMRRGFPQIAAPFLSVDRHSSLFVLKRIGVPINRTVGKAENNLATRLADRYIRAVSFPAPPGHTLAYVGAAGIAPFTVEGVAVTAKDLAVQEMVATPLCFLILACVVKSWRLMVITFCCMFCGNVLCFAMLDVYAEHVAVMSTSVPSGSAALLVALTFDYSLFLLVRFQDEISDGASLREALIASLRYSGHVIIGSGFTLCYCVLTIQILPLAETKCVSIGGLAAILTAMGVNLLLTPALLLAFPEFFAAEASPEYLSRALAKGRVNENGSISVQSYCSDVGDGVGDESSEDSSDDGPSEDFASLAGGSPNSRGKPFSRRQQDRARRRSSSGLRQHSQFWLWWGDVSTSPFCSIAVALLLLVVAFLAACSPWRLSLMQPSEDFFLMGSLGSHVLGTLRKVGHDFSEGYVGPVTLLIVAKHPANVAVSGTPSIYSDECWSSATGLLQRIDEELLDDGNLGSILSVMYVSSPAGGRFAVPKTFVKTAGMISTPDAHPVGIAAVSTMEEKLDELRYMIGETVNEAKTAVTAAVAPNIRTTSKEAVAWTRRARALLEEFNAQPSSAVEVFLLSQTSTMMDIEDTVYGSVPLFVMSSLLGCVLIVGIFFRSLLLAIRSIVSIAFTLSIVYMLAIGIFQMDALAGTGIPLGGSSGLFFMVPVMTFTINVGLALDYDIFLLTRIVELRERSGGSLSTEEATAMGLVQTGPIINCAGLIMTVAFGGMIFSDVPSMKQTAFLFMVAVLLDTFCVRTVVTPALTAALGEANWWPRQFKPRNH